jgi:hypothetical protein
MWTIAVLHITSETAFCLVAVCLAGFGLFALLHNVTGRSRTQLDTHHSLQSWRAARKEMALDCAIAHSNRRQQAQWRKGLSA